MDKSVMMLTINGDIFLFQDNELTLEQKENLRNIADGMSQESPTQRGTTEKEISSRFIDKVKSCLGINLVHVTVSFVVRINCEFSN